MNSIFEWIGGRELILIRKAINGLAYFFLMGSVVDSKTRPRGGGERMGKTRKWDKRLWSKSRNHSWRMFQLFWISRSNGQPGAVRKNSLLALFPVFITSIMGCVEFELCWRRYGLPLAGLISSIALLIRVSLMIFLIAFRWLTLI